jgi:biopolymer transport protein ExbB
MRKVVVPVGVWSLGLILWALAVAPLPAAAAQGDWQRADAEVRERSQEMRDDAAAMRQDVAGDRRQTTMTVAERRARVRALQQEYDALAKALQGRVEERTRLEADLEAEQEGMRALEGTIRQAAKDADKMLADNPLTALAPGSREVVDGLLRNHAFPDMATIGRLADVFLDELRLTGGVQRRQGDYTGPDGTQRTGEILHAARFATFYRAADGEVGVLAAGADGQGLRAVPDALPRGLRSDVKDFFDGRGALLPLDVADGAAFRRNASSDDLWDWLRSGGFLVWPILLVGVVGLGLGLVRFITLGSSRAFSETRMREIVERVERGEIAKAKEYCARGGKFPACRVLGRALDHLGLNQEVLENALQEAILQELPRLERFLPSMQILAAIAPLLGLLGTVTGMINTFQVITLFGTGDPRMMSGGISEALITTQLGLAVAIPIMVLHHFLERRVDVVLGDMEQKGTAFTVTLLKAGAVVPHGDNVVLRGAEGA